MGTLFILFGSWLAGMGLLFLYLRNENARLTINDVLITYILSGAIGLVFSFAGWKANILHWLTAIAFAGLAAFITNKLLNKKK